MKKKQTSRAWWLKTVIPVVRTPRQEDYKFEGILGYLIETLSQQSAKRNGP